MQTLAGRLARSRVSDAPAAMPRPCSSPRSASFFWSRSATATREALERRLRRLARAADRGHAVEGVADRLGGEPAAVVGIRVADGLAATGSSPRRARRIFATRRRGRMQRLLVLLAAEAVLLAEPDHEHALAGAASPRRASSVSPGLPRRSPRLTRRAMPAAERGIELRRGGGEGAGFVQSDDRAVRALACGRAADGIETHLCSCLVDRCHLGRRIRLVAGQRSRYTHVAPRRPVVAGSRPRSRLRTPESTVSRPEPRPVLTRLDRYLLRESRPRPSSRSPACCWSILLSNQLARVLGQAVQGDFPGSVVLTLHRASRRCSSSRCWCRSGCSSASCSRSVASTTRAR